MLKEDCNEILLKILKNVEEIENGMKFSRGLKITLIILAMFFYIYNPVFSPIEPRKLVDVFSIIYCFCYMISKRIITVDRKVKKNIISPLFLFLFYIILSCVIRLPFNSEAAIQQLLELFRLTTIISRISFNTFAFYQMIVKLKIKEEEVVRIVFVSGLIECFFVILSFAFPEVRHFFATLIQKYSDNISVIQYTQYVTIKGFGFAENLYDIFGYVTAFITTIVFTWGISRNSKAYIWGAIVLLAIQPLNSRTGLVLSAVCMIIVSICYFKRVFIKYFLWLVLFGVISYFVFVQFIPDNMAKYITNGLQDIFNLMIAGRRTGFFEDIASQNVYPDNVIFGEGASPEALGVGNVDYGYLQCMWRYGIIGTFIMIFAIINYFYYMFMKLKKHRDKFGEIYVICCAFLFFVFLYKLYAIGAMGASFMCFGIPFILSGFSKQLKEPC